MVGLKTDLLEVNIQECIESLPTKTSSPKALEVVTYIKQLLESWSIITGVLYGGARNVINMTLLVMLLLH